MPAEPHLAVINWGVFPGQTYAKRAGGQQCRLLPTVSANTAHFWSRTGRPTSWERLDWIERKGDAAAGFTYDTSRLERHAEVGVRRRHPPDPLACRRREIGLHPRPGQPRGSAGTEWRTSATIATQEHSNRPIQRRGWQDRFLVAITDEPFIHHEESFAAAVDLVHQAAPSVAYVEAVETEYLGKLDVYVPKLSHLNLWYPHFDKTAPRTRWRVVVLHLLPSGRTIPEPIPRSVAAQGARAPLDQLSLRSRTAICIGD